MQHESDTQRSGSNNKLLPWIGVEHVVVALILIVVGVVLIWNAHTDLTDDITRLARRLGIDPSSNGVQGLLGRAKKFTPDKLRVYGFVAVAFGVLEGTEGCGLIRRKRWGEYLTVVATLILFIPDIYELVTKPSILKLALFLLNVAMITYLAIHLWKTKDEAKAGDRVPSHNPAAV